MDKLFFILLIWLVGTTMAIYAECSSVPVEGSICSLEELQNEQKHLEDVISKHKIIDKDETYKHTSSVKAEEEKKIDLHKKQFEQTDSHNILKDNSSD